MKKVVDMLQETIVLCKDDGVLINYHPTRKLVPNMAGAAVTFALVLGLREARAFRMWTILESLTSSQCRRLRRERRGRSPLAQAIAQELRQMLLSLRSGI